MTPETMEDWGTCLATGFGKMDPMRGAVALKGVLKLCLPDPVQGDSDPNNDTSFSVRARLYALQVRYYSFFNRRLRDGTVSIL